jgi:two-component system, chemotaxis family, CheB/CheR fusion protein
MAKRTKSPFGLTSSDEASERRKGAFPIVGIGASAGGIEAFTQTLEHLPSDTGMAFVFIQHLHPDYESALTEILGRQTTMPVVEAKDDMAVRPNHVYVIPPDAYLGIFGGMLLLLPRPHGHERRLPIDQFFRYLAEDHRTRAIGIVLSGTGSDGVLGLKAIKAEGGITFAQDEASAKYDGMPRSAVASGAVDFVLSPSGIAAELARIARHPYIVEEHAGGTPELLSDAAESLDKIFMLMRRHSGHDFTYYKHTTIRRRIRRRMLLHKLDRMEDYVRFAQEHPAELDDLFQDILINVTSFFRDPEAFEVLREKVFPTIVPDPPPAHPVRIWVPGCSTGEEAYSVAIAFLEYLGEHGATTPTQVFATDIDEVAIARARTGIYPENIAQDVSTERLRRFFVKVEGGYQVCKSIRDMCVFAVQDVTRDPPFSRMDFISCRNLLIYLGPVLQKRVMRVFHYALNPHGFLLLGTAESIGEHSELFRVVDAKEKVYAKKSIVSPVLLDLSTALEAPSPAQSRDPGRRLTGRRQPVAGPFDVQREADRVLMSSYVPPAVVINDNMEILLFRGRSGAYLEPASGEASLNLLKMAREDLMVGLNAAVRESMATHAPASRRDIHWRTDGTSRRVDIEVTPLPAPAEQEHRFYLVVFREPSAPLVVEADTESAVSPPEDERARMVVQLEQELVATKEYLQSVIEQKETNNEELRSANEEIQSSNEELQSINEELETAKEELQSTNEELATVNDELENRNAELERANNDLSNLIASMDIPIVIVGMDLRIRRFTPQSEKLLNLISADVGRPISDIKPNINVAGFTKMLTTAIDDVQTSEQDACDANGHWYSVRVRPYRTQDNKIDGAVIAFVDVDALKRALDEAQAARDYGEAIIAAVRHPLLVLDKDLRVVSASSAYLQTFQVSSEETLDNLVYRLGNGQWAIPGLRKQLNQVVKEDREFYDFPVEHEFQHIGARRFRVSGRRIHASRTGGPMILMQIEADSSAESAAADGAS